ncbi:MAG: hypothetical protein U0946_02060 [Patescibacteria group bacterium]|nr:hypothetical protein [Patescibacteria group bacterium]
MKKIEQIKIYYKQVDNLALDKTAKIGLKIVFLSLAFSFLWLGGWWHKLPPEVPLLYSRAYGESRLISQWGLWLLPGSSLIINLISIRLAGSLIEKDKLLAQILIWLAVLTNMMTLVGLIKIVLLVI